MKSIEEFRPYLTAQDFVDELHHLLWIESDSSFSSPDCGWSCRDHAFIVAGVLQMLGFRAAICSGRAAFVQGCGAGSEPVVLGVAKHAWVGVDDNGYVDLSIRLDPDITRLSEFPRWRKALLFGSKFQDEDAAFRLFLEEEGFFKELSLAQERTQRCVGLYLQQQCPAITHTALAECLKYSNPRLRERLQASFGTREDFHAKAILHFHERVVAKAPALTQMGWIEAWSKILDRPGNAVYRVASRGKLPA